MKHTHNRSMRKKLLALVLAVVMVMCLMPVSAFAEEGQAEAGPQAETVEPAAVDAEETAEPEEPIAEEPEEEPAEDAADTYADTNEINYVEKIGSGKELDNQFYRMFLLDCGRKYFEVSEIEEIIDQLAEKHFTHIELAFGNDGLRFLLDDMSLTVNGTKYDSDKVKEAIEYGNGKFGEIAGTNVVNNAWTEKEMDTIISYANEKGIGVVPLFNSPGHLCTVINAMEELGLGTNGKKVGESGTSKINYAIDPTNATAVHFVQALMEKYAAYFAGQGCTIFNIGADESGITDDSYTAYAKLVNSNAAIVQNAGMVAMAFNDGIYDPAHTSALNGVEFDKNIVISYWTHNDYATASALATMGEKGFKINSTHNKWYYVLGNNDSSWFGYEWAKSNLKSIKCDQVDSGYTTTNGCTLAVWCDNPDKKYSDNKNNIFTLIETMADQNPEYFKESSGSDADTPEITAPKSIALDSDKDGVTLTSSVAAKWKSSDEGVVKLEAATQTRAVTEYTTSVKAIPVSVGTATITATTENNKTASFTIEVKETAESGLTEKTITVTVGGTAKDTIKGENHAGTYTTEDSGIATVDSAVYEDAKTESALGSQVSMDSNGTYSGVISDSNGNYMVIDSSGNISSTSNIVAATKFDVTRSSSRGSISYIIKGENRYLTINNSSLSSSTSSTSWSYNSSNGFYKMNRGATYYLCYNNGWKVNTQSGSSKGLLYSVDEKSIPAGTTITFRGVAEGTTYVTIGSVRYTIKVTKEDLSQASSLPIQLWITNNTIEADGTSATKTTGTGWGGDAGTANYVSVSANKAYGERGISVVEALGLTEPLTRYEWGGTRFINAKDDKAAQNLVYWSSRVHKSSDSNIQTVWGADGTDYSNSGTEFAYVRYYGGKWAVSNDRTDWSNIVTGEGSTGAYSGCKEQLAAYYMVRTQITDEVTTDVADWGEPEGGDKYDEQLSSSNGYVLLDFAVKYESGTRNPDAFPVSGKTMAYHCSGNPGGTINGTKYRELNNFRAVNTSNYEVYMVTVTMTNDAAGTTISDTSSYTYGGTEEILWAIDQDTKNSSGLSEYTAISGDTTYSGCTIGGDPYIRGLEVYNKHGALITYYVRAKVTEDSLKVHYVNQTTGEEFYSYPISVKSGTVFADNFGQAEANSTQLIGNTVENFLGKTETVYADLSTMPAIGAQYRYSDYTCVDTKRNDGGKDVYLYYTFSSTKTFVVDFGLPLVIKPVEVAGRLQNAKIERMSIAKSSKYAKITTDEAHNITYTLDKMIDGQDDITVTYYGTNANGEEDHAAYTLSIIPASSVYYEDSFVSTNDGKGAAEEATWSADPNGAAANLTPAQALEELGDKTNVYGHDAAYKDSTEFSMGSAQKVTVSKAMVDNWNDHDDSAWPSATFTFKGTGFDVISLTDNTSGAIFVDVTQGSTKVKSLVVNNYYGYTCKDGKWEVVKPEEGTSNALYQIPVIKVSGLNYDEYTVTIRAAYSEFFDTADQGRYNFWLDAIRVYDPMGKDYESYAQDKEGYPKYIKLRNGLTTTDTDKTVEFITTNTKVSVDGQPEATIDEYKNYGPNNEVYLAKGQAITFKVSANSNIASVQIGAKAPEGKDATMKVTVNGNTAEAATRELKTATEMYYELLNKAESEQSVVIANDGDGLLSLTNLKITYTTKPAETASLAALTDSDKEQAVETVRALFASAPEVKTFTPSRLEASWGRAVREGKKATLTVKASEDVESITVDGQTITNYRTRTERSGWGWWAERVTYREFTYTITAEATADYTITAQNSEGAVSQPVTATLTVNRGGWFWGRR